MGQFPNNKTSLSRVINDVLSRPQRTFVVREKSKMNPSSPSRSYKGPFKMSFIKEDEKFNLKILEGVVMLGSGKVNIKETTFDLEENLESTGTWYIYASIYSKVLFGGETVVYEYKASKTIPIIAKVDQDGVDRWTYPVIIGTVDATITTTPAPEPEEGEEAEEDTVVSSFNNTVQFQYGYHYMAGVLS